MRGGCWVLLEDNAVNTMLAMLDGRIFDAKEREGKRICDGGRNDDA
jgi:hypothetical protein